MKDIIELPKITEYIDTLNSKSSIASLKTSTKKFFNEIVKQSPETYITDLRLLKPEEKC